jgi:ATP-binding cassette, subfamily B, bacterial
MSETKAKTISEWQILTFFWNATAKHTATFLGGFLMPLGFLSLSTLFPYYTGKLLAALGTDPHAAPQYLPYLLVVGLIGVLGNRYGAVFLFRLQARVISELQTLCLNSLLRQSTSFHNNRVAGKLVSDAIEFPQAYGLLSNSFLINIIPLVSSLILGIVLVSVRSWELGLILLGMVIVVIGVALLQSHYRKPLRTRRLVATKAVTAHLADTIVNNQTVKTFAREEEELAQHRTLNKTLLDIRLSDWASGAKAGNNRMIGLLFFQLLFAVVIIGLVERDPSLLATGIFAFTYSVTLSNNLISFNSTLRQIEDGFLQAEPMMKVISTTPAIQDQSDSVGLQVSKGKIDFNQVDFSYQDSSSQESVFEQLDLHIAAGEKVGLVGSSGGGKSTLTRLLLRFDDIQGGSITIDGQNIAKVTQNSLRQAIAYVPQEPLMFHRSIAENIAYGNLDANPEDIVQAAKLAYADGFITQLPQGYDTLVGERGVKLSGGQRQRVAIARAILKDAPILLLDEATSALDSESEVLIQQALQKLMKGRTAIVIAHRLSTIQKMDRIIVLDGGKIVEQGTHKDLLAKKGTYATLWAHQSGGFLES